MNTSKPLKFKVQHGYDKGKYIVIEEKDLQRAIYAWLEQIPLVIGDGMIHGKSILSIEPHYHYYTGWNDSYSPHTGEDWAQIKRDCPDFTGIIEGTITEVKRLISTGQVHLIGKPPAKQKQLT